MKRRARSSHPEAIEQRLFVKRFRMDPRTRGLPACAVPNGMRTSALQAALAKAEGVSKGAPDWFLFVAGRCPGSITYRVGLALEFKRPPVKGKPKGRVSPEQKRWHEQLRDNGWRVEVVTSAEQAWSILTDYLTRPPCSRPSLDPSDFDTPRNGGPASQDTP